MARYLTIIRNLALPVFAGFVALSSAAAEEGTDTPTVVAAAGAEGEAAEEAIAPGNTPDKPIFQSSVAVGYRFLSSDGYGGRAAEFDYLHSSPTFGLRFNRLGRSLKYSLEGSYLNDKDYSGEYSLDYRGEFRLLLRTESLFHNLDRYLLFPGFDSPAEFLPSYTAMQQDPNGRYGMRVEQDWAAARYKIHDAPVHFNVGYWRMLREGTQQLIFADQAFEGPGNILYAVPRSVNFQIHEGTFGADAHAGPLDFVYLFTIRQSQDTAAVPADFFVERFDFSGNRMSVGGVQQHNQSPDSRYMSHTVKVHTSLSGGIVGGGSYTFATRDNLSRLTDVTGAREVSTTLHNAAGDFVYTPCKEFSLALKYRMQQVESDSPSVIGTSFMEPRIVAVRPSLDMRKHLVTATASLRPTTTVSFIGAYEGSFAHRDNLAAGADPRLHWRDLPADTDTHRGTFTVISRPVKGLRLKALYSYGASDNPLYGASPSEMHEGKVLLSYNGAGRWGATAGYHGVRENNDGIVRYLLNQQFEFTPYGSPLSRERNDNKISASLWFSPLRNVTISGGYSFLKSTTDQGVLLTGFAPAVFDWGRYTNQAHLYSVGSSYHASEAVDISLQFQQVRSLSEFDPVFVMVGPHDTGGIREISRTRAVENSFSARSDIKVSDTVSCVFDYSFREYRDKASGIYSGNAQAVMVQLHGTW